MNYFEYLGIKIYLGNFKCVHWILHQNEFWKDIKDHVGLYQVSTLGRVKSLAKIRGFKTNGKDLILSQNKVPDKYNRVVLVLNKKQKWIAIHRLVAIAFIPNSENKLEVNHIDGNKSNSNKQNLEWVTAQENQLHSYHVLKRKSTTKRCYQYDRNGIFIRSFESLTEAAFAIGITRTRISCACLRTVVKKGNLFRETKIAGGYMWSYELKSA